MREEEELVFRLRSELTQQRYDNNYSGKSGDSDSKHRCNHAVPSLSAFCSTFTAETLIY